jgi:hypothetical protein
MVDTVPTPTPETLWHKDGLRNVASILASNPNDGMIPDGFSSDGRLIVLVCQVTRVGIKSGVPTSRPHGIVGMYNLLSRNSFRNRTSRFQRMDRSSYPGAAVAMTLHFLLH